jgi:hypothetical protein
MGEVIAFPRVPAHPNAVSRLSEAELDRYLDLLDHGYVPDLALAVLGRVPCDGAGDG